MAGPQLPSCLVLHSLAHAHGLHRSARCPAPATHHARRAHRHRAAQDLRGLLQGLPGSRPFAPATFFYMRREAARRVLHSTTTRAAAARQDKPRLGQLFIYIFG